MLCCAVSFVAVSSCLASVCHPVHFLAACARLDYLPTSPTPRRSLTARRHRQSTTSRRKPTTRSPRSEPWRPSRPSSPSSTPPSSTWSVVLQPAPSPASSALPRPWRPRSGLVPPVLSLISAVLALISAVLILLRFFCFFFWLAADSGQGRGGGRVPDAQRREHARAASRPPSALALSMPGGADPTWLVTCLVTCPICGGSDAPNDGLPPVFGGPGG